MTKQQRKLEFLLGVVLSAMIAALALIGYGSGEYPAESIMVFLLMFLPITLAPTICSSRPLARPVLPVSQGERSEGDRARDRRGAKHGTGWELVSISNNGGHTFGVFRTPFPPTHKGKLK